MHGKLFQKHRHSVKSVFVLLAKRAKIDSSARGMTTQFQCIIVVERLNRPMFS
jgi:hypothetical protein